jgi:hypothetical protein
MKTTTSKFIENQAEEEKGGEENYVYEYFICENAFGETLCQKQNQAD